MNSTTKKAVIKMQFCSLYTMAGIRIRNVPKDEKEKTLKIHFSKPENGGGKIKKIYFPLFNNDAVILYEKKEVVDSVTQMDHLMGAKKLEIQTLPEHMIFTSLSARLDPDASVLVQATQSLHDEMMFGENIRLVEEADQTYTLHGNWFQLEWAWHYIDCFMQQQEIIQHEINQQPQRYAGTPREVDQSELSRGVTSPRNSPRSPLEVNSQLRKNIDQRSQNLDASLSLGARQKKRDIDMNQASGSHRSHDVHVSQSGHQESSSGVHHAFSDDDDDVASPALIDQLRKANARRTEDDRGNKHSRDLVGMYDRENYVDDDERGIPSLHGEGFVVPSDTLHGSLQMPEARRSDDQNDTFQQFSGQSLGQTAEHETADADYGRTANRDQGHAHETSVKDKHEDTGLLSSSQSSNLSTQSKSATPVRKESLSKYSKPSGNLSDTSVGGPSPRTTPPRVSHSALRSNIPDRYTEDQLLSSFDINGMKVTLYYGNIAQEETDAIVNPANENLEHYGGLAYILRQARGAEMDLECRNFIRHNGSLKTTEVTHTSGGGKIKSSHIIHAAGPMWLTPTYREKFTRQLTQTFLNCLNYAEERLWIRSVALPYISTGVYGAPLDVCVKCFLNAVLIFTAEGSTDHRLNDVRLVNNDAESTVTSIVLVQTQLDMGIPALSADAHELMMESKEKSETSRTAQLNLPRGRQDTGGALSQTMRGTTGVLQRLSSQEAERDSGSGLKSYTHRRTSSLSRMPQRKSDVSSDDSYSLYGSRATEGHSSRDKGYGSRATEGHSGRDKGYGSRATGGYSSGDKGYGSRATEGYSSGDKSSGSNSSHERSREKTRSYTQEDKTSLSSAKMSQTIGGRSKLKMDDFMDKSMSPRSTKSADTGSRAAPKIKQNLLPSGQRLKSTRPTTTTTSSFGQRTSDDYGAFSRPHSGLTGRHDTSDEDEFGLQSLPADLSKHTFRERFLQGEQKLEKCAICLDTVRDPKQLKCNHVFCHPCIDEHFRKSKPACPVCGSIFGRVKGDQPIAGRMTYKTDRDKFLPGYEGEDGMIIITYTFPDGRQEHGHPHPGRSYKGISRKAYLPNSVEGREVLRLLRKAFDARLVFTIGDSKMSGKSDVLTWNDIHHKTSINGGPTRFGYPDPTYLDRVRDELADKGIVSEK
ncbi:uncharacterized protein LOC128211381 isoform X1 [Mya arenaria]|uniref:uncharacterized protein LOC128211381 isoform X1 n=2 Tax=Mya arenaria TaxID=6604 RepID=UPI0022E0CB23|nr:uncharacterized protein LOC128211381 isoform X1 [Mya arenaria]